MALKIRMAVAIATLALSLSLQAKTPENFIYTSSGELDAAFPRLTLLEFDADLDQARLEAAGYTSQMIPLFMRPAADGQASGRQIQSSIKGPSAVAEITPRLRRLIAD